MASLANITTSLMMLAILSACANTSTSQPTNSQPSKPIPEQQDRSSYHQLGKNDFDRMTDVEIRENTERYAY